MASTSRICASLIGALWAKSKRVRSAVHQRTLLLHMAAQHLAQGLVHQVGGAVVAHGGGAQRGVHPGGDA
jgi:hypothetical protein